VSAFNRILRILPSSWFSKPGFLIGALAIGLGWRLAIAAHVYPIFRPGTPDAGDAQSYLTLAEHLIAGNGYTLDSQPPYDPYASRAPVYPLFLALALKTGGSLAGIVIGQVLIDLALAWILFRLARELWPERPLLAPLALVLWALCPAVGSVAGRLLAEVLATALAAAAMLFLAVALAPDRARPVALAAAFSSGAALMAAVLARPQLVGVLLLLPVLIAGFVGQRSRVDSRSRREPSLRSSPRARWVPVGCALVAGLIVVEGPWVIRNARAFSEFVPFARGHAERALAMGLAEPHRTETKAEVDERLMAAGVLPDASAHGPDGRSYLQFAKSQVERDVGSYVQASFARAVLLWVTPRTSIYGLSPSRVLDAVRHPEGPGGGRALFLTLGLGLYYAVLLGLAALGFLRSRRDPALAALFLAFPLGITAVSMWFHLESRYVLPAFPVVVLACAHALEPALRGRERGGRSEPRSAPADAGRPPLEPPRRAPAGMLGS
jgi:hypothetical protein